jgi:glycosyltransferase involved in cell wall biosynthesis
LPEIHGEIELEHLHRYLMAKELAHGKIVLDIASGEGYGSNMLAEVADQVYGVDLSREAVTHANRKYGKSNLEFLIGSCAEIPLADNSIDLVVSFETIEHHDQHEEMMREIKRVLRRDGLALISSPEKYEYSINPNFNNPYHVKELYRHQFEGLMAKSFKSMLLYGQRILYGSGILLEESSGTACCYTRENLNKGPSLGLSKPLYLIALASDGDLPNLAGSIFEDNIQESQIVQDHIATANNKDDQIKSLSLALNEGEAQIVDLHLAVGERDKQIVNFTLAVGERDARIDNLSLAVAERDGQICELHITVGERNKRIETLIQAVGERNARIAALDLVAAERDGQICELHMAVGERDRQVEDFTLALGERDGQVENLALALAERDSQIENFTLALAEHDRQIYELHMAVGHRDKQIENFYQSVAERDRQIENLNQALADRDGRIASILISKSWRLTAPFRRARRILSFSKRYSARKIASDTSRAAWRKLPVAVELKTWLRNKLFIHMPLLFQWSTTYRNWQRQNAAQANSAASPSTADSAETYCAEDEYLPRLTGPPLEDKPVRLIAFYLPQYHPIPENDEWWGEGFTEWTNVRPAKPQFLGHYQPRIPGELGYYNLLDPVVQRGQIELAKLYGIEGFSFYFYWFGGKRLLEAPLQNYLGDPSLDLPFCLCWANENWSRRWDGLNKDILIAQQHSTEDDLAFIAHVATYMRDSRYIRINGKPLLIVYRPSLLPSAIETAKRWRDWCRCNGLGEIYLAYTQSFEIVDPAKYGFDAAIEFPPNNSTPPDITDHVKPIDGSFVGTVYDWKIFLERSHDYDSPSYLLFRSVCPAWDNTARRKKYGTVFLNSTPSLYRTWLENAIQDTKLRFNRSDEQLVFINAWNEWAEGAHLEPDQKYGYAFLAATRKALETAAAATGLQRKLIVVSHDAFPAGAQFLALGMVRSLSQELKLSVHTVLLDSGRLEVEFEKLSPVSELFPGSDFEQRAGALASELKNRGFTQAILNATPAGKVCRIFAESGIRCVYLIHELPGVIRRYGLEQEALDIARYAQSVVFPAHIVAQGFSTFAEIPPERFAILPQGLWRRNPWRFKLAQARSEVRKQLGFADDAPIVLSVGYADRRKGVDIFVKAALEILKCNPDVRFVWIGHWESEIRAEVDELIQSSGQEEAFRLIGYEPETAIFHAGADAYALPSREDPFPNVVLESFDAGIPVIAFEGTGGGAQLVEQVGGLVVSNGDIAAFANALLTILSNPPESARLGTEAMEYVDNHHAFNKYLFELCGFCGITLPRISVIVPNYNYGKHIKARLDSIVSQTVPIFELIILDDCSTDDSVEKIVEWLTDNSGRARFLINESNSGNVFAQWFKGASLATGDYLWIAEADDLCKENLLEILLRPFADPELVLSYCDSEQIDERGNKIGENYQPYLNEVCCQRWRSPYVRNGREEIGEALAIMNTIPNVSGVLLRRQSLIDVLEHELTEIKSLLCAGDWLTYIKLLSHGKVGYSPITANVHRRHTQSVIGGANGQALLDEIAQVQQFVASQFHLEASVQLHAAQYLEKLRNQFGLGGQD